VGALSTLRGGGISPAPYDDGNGGGGLNLGIHVGDDAANVAHNRALLSAVLPGRPAWLSQVHGVAVADAACLGENEVPEADAGIASVSGKVCAILSADCLPVLFCDSAGKVVGAAHAGWRGLAGGVLQHTLAAMRAAGAGEILAWLGPAIGPRRFEVGTDVLSAFEAGAAGAQGRQRVVAAFAAIDGKPGKYLADIYALARSVLSEQGVSRVSGGQHCTVAEAGRFYSYRRDGITGRQASLIWIK
ncbi:MAG TPA: peptidoglycan editing factor PgeF, partial [Janthinobacterium sp.]|nr:peptidoglycan editing factor PgeF [Janthinobacterium sp.]